MKTFSRTFEHGKIASSTRRSRRGHRMGSKVRNCLFLSIFCAALLLLLLLLLPRRHKSSEKDTEQVTYMQTVLSDELLVVLVTAC